MSASRSASLGDSLAISLSAMCLAHCLALPLAASLLPVMGAWAEAEWAHWLFAALAAPISIMTLARPGRRSPALLGMAMTGLLLLVAGAAEWPSPAQATPMTITGGLILASVHVLNWRRRTACPLPDQHRHAED